MLTTGGRASSASAQESPKRTSYGGSNLRSADDTLDATVRSRAQSPADGDDGYRAILERLETQEKELRVLRKRLSQTAGPASLVRQPDPDSGYGPLEPPDTPPMPHGIRGSRPAKLQ